MKKRKFSFFAIVVLTTIIFGVIPVSAENTSEKTTSFEYNRIMETYYSNIPEEIKNIKIDIKEEKEYLTDEEISKVTPEIIKNVLNKIHENPEINTQTETERNNQYVANLIKEEIENSDSNNNLTYLPGYDRLNAAEKKLAKSHPIEFTKYVDSALIATSESEKRKRQSMPTFY